LTACTTKSTPALERRFDRLSTMVELSDKDDLT
jgi:hypothetical protein